MANDISRNEKINKAEQFQQECAGWTRLLDFFKQENSFLKNRLSVVLDHKADKDFLNEAEHFLSQFILKDEFITEIARDVKVQDGKLKQLLLQKAALDDKIIKQQQKLRNEIEHLEKEFAKMKNDFNKRLHTVL